MQGLLPRHHRDGGHPGCKRSKILDPETRKTMKPNSLKRRKFLKISSAFLASSTMAGGTLSFNQHKSLKAAQTSEEEKVVPTLCELCFWRCGVNAHVRDGKVYKITGQEQHPLSNGRLCPRGTGGHGLLYDPNRLKHPLIRETVNGKEMFRKADWEEAITLVADNFMRIREEYGHGSVVTFTHGFGASFLKVLCASCGMISAPSYAQCRGPREDAFKLTFGHSVGSPEALDIKNSQYLVLIGAHLGENMHNTAVQDFADAIGNGCRIVVVDPRFSVAAGKAERWLPIRPGTDLALLRAWIRVLIEEELYDRTFVEENTVGLEEVREGVKDATPETTAALTGIAAEDIIAVARDLGRYKNHALIHPGRRVTWYGDDTQRERAIAILNALLGNYRRPGGLFKQNKYGVPKPKFPIAIVGERKFVSRYPFASSVPASEILQQTIKGDPWPIKGWMVYGTNMIHSLGNQSQTLEALNQLEFMVAIDVLPMEITSYADVILPEHTYLERYDDLDDRSYRVPYVGLRQPVVPPLYDTKSGYEIAKMLSEKMGKFDLFPDDVETYLDGRLREVNSSLAEIKEKGVLKKPEMDFYRKPWESLKFRTPSGKIELASSKLKASGFDAVPRYTPPQENPPGYFRLLFGRAPMHTFGRTANNRFLGELMPENELWVNEITGKDMKLKPGEYVYLINQDGVKSKTPIKIRLTQRIRPDSVYMVHGFGHTHPELEQAYGRGASDADLITRLDIDPIMGGTGMQNNFVTFTRKA